MLGQLFVSFPSKAAVLQRYSAEALPPPLSTYFSDEATNRKAEGRRHREGEHTDYLEGTLDLFDVESQVGSLIRSNSSETYLRL